MKSWWAFLLGGLAFLAGSLLVEKVEVSVLLGVVAFSSFWSILELFKQKERVRKGWFPKNPKRKYDRKSERSFFPFAQYNNRKHVNKNYPSTTIAI